MLEAGGGVADRLVSGRGGGCEVRIDRGDRGGLVDQLPGGLPLLVGGLVVEVLGDVVVLVAAGRPTQPGAGLLRLVTGVPGGVLVGVVGPVVLAYMLVQRIIALIVDGYGGLPGWYTALFGWGTIAVLVVIAVVMSLLKWRRSPDDFTPWPPYPPASAPSRTPEVGMTR